MTERGSKPNAGYTGGTVGAGVPRRSAVQRIRESLDLTEEKGGVGAVVRRVIGELQVGDRRSEVGESDLEKREVEFSLAKGGSVLMSLARREVRSYVALY